MPIVNGKYKNPGWENNTAPAIDETELNALSNTVESLDAERGQSPVLKGNVEIQGQDAEASVTFSTNSGPRTVKISTNTEVGEIGLAFDDGNTANNPVRVSGIKEPTEANDAVNKEYADTKAPKINPKFTPSAEVVGQLLITNSAQNEEGVALAGGYDSDEVPYLEVLGTQSDENIRLRHISTPQNTNDAVNKAYVDGIKTSVKTILQAIYDLLATNAWDTTEAVTGVQALQQLINQL